MGIMDLFRPNRARTLYDNGTRAFLEGRHDEAIDLLEQSIAQDPTFPDAYNNLGMVYIETGEIAAAIEVLREAVVVRPDFAQAHNNLGRALYIANDIAGALSAFDDAIAIDPGYQKARENRAAVSAWAVGNGPRTPHFGEIAWLAACVAANQLDERQAQRLVGVFVRVGEREEDAWLTQADEYAKKGDERLAAIMRDLAEENANPDYQQRLSDLPEDQRLNWIEIVLSGADRAI